MNDPMGFALAALANAAGLIAGRGCGRGGLRLVCADPAAGLERDDWCAACVAQDALDCAAAQGSVRDRKPAGPQRLIRLDRKCRCRSRHPTRRERP